MKISTLIMTVTAAGLLASANAQLAKGGAKYLGNITMDEYNPDGTHIPNDFGTLWNQITAENKCKWGEIHKARYSYDFSGCDEAYAWAVKNNAHFKFHALVWGSQYPSFINSLDANTLRTVIDEWMAAVADHYKAGNKITATINGQSVTVTAKGLEMIDVVNEAIYNAPSQYNGYKESYHSGYLNTKIIEALACTPDEYKANGNKCTVSGDKENGVNTYRFVANAFKMARKYFPNTILIYNDYNTIQWNIDQGIDLVQKIIKLGAPVDAYGQQSHDVTGLSSTGLKNALEKIHNAVGIPLFITEYDVGGNGKQYYTSNPSDENDAGNKNQLNDYKNHIPFLWETPWIAGITLWGYVYGKTWINCNSNDEDKSAPGAGCSGLIKDGVDRPAMTWLREYFKNNLSKGQNTTDFSYLDGGSTTTSSASTATSSASSEPEVNRKPYNGQVANLPGKIEVEYFDEGDNEVTYYDKSAGNEACGATSTECNTLREGTDVDLKKTASGAGVIGWFQTDEWLEYTVNVTKEGTYTLYVAAASSNGGKVKFTFTDANGKLVAETDDIVVTGANAEGSEDAEEDYSEYTKTKGVNVKLPAGKVIVRMTCTEQWIDVDYFNLAYGENAKDNAEIGQEVEPEFTPVEELENKSSSSKTEAIFADRLNLRSSTLEDYDVFDMQGNFMGRLSAYSMGEAFSTVKNSNVIKMNGTYFIRNKATGYSKAMRIVK